MSMEQGKEKLVQEPTIEDKINDPKTSWGELTKIRDDLQQELRQKEQVILKTFATEAKYFGTRSTMSAKELVELSESVTQMRVPSQQFLLMVDSYHDIKRLLTKTQERINKEEPKEIMQFRIEEEKLKKEIEGDPWIGIGLEIQDDKTSVNRLLQIEHQLKATLRFDEHNYPLQDLLNQTQKRLGPNHLTY